MPTPDAYKNDREWSNPYIPAITKIVGPMLLTEAPYHVDIHQATDLVVITAEPMTIACRVRRPGYLAQYPWDVTIRYRRDNGAETEYNKFRQGWCDWAFYGHAAYGDKPDISRWFLYDLNSWRLWFADLIDPTQNQGGIRCGIKPNDGDGTHFAWFDVRTFPSGMLIAASTDVETITPQPTFGVQHMTDNGQYEWWPEEAPPIRYRADNSLRFD